MTTGKLAELKRLRGKYGDWLLTLLSVLLVFIIFVIIPLQATGLVGSQLLMFLALLAVIAGVLVISINPVALGILSAALITHALVIIFRLYRPLTYDLHIVTATRLIIVLTLLWVVARAVFGPGRVTFHRIVGAGLLYLLIALTFSVLFSLIGFSFSEAFKGLTFEYDSALFSRSIYFSLVTMTSTGYGDIVPVHPLARSLCNLEAVIGQLYPAILLARLVTLELGGHHL